MLESGPSKALSFEDADLNDNVLLEVSSSSCKRKRRSTETQVGHYRNKYAIRKFRVLC